MRVKHTRSLKLSISLINVIFGGLLLLICMSCTNENEKGDSVYTVQRTSEAVSIDADWEKSFWQNVPALSLAHHMGEKPAHMPVTEAKLRYDDQAIYVIFRVQDQYVRAVADSYQGPVYRDSCVEFFFTPGADITAGYFNLEMNCGGQALFMHQLKRETEVTPVSADHFSEVTVAHSLPEIIDPEISEPTTWTVEYRLPFNVLANYTSLKAPEAGTVWRANFYKCADATSAPHWLTWAKVDFPRPNFHLPEFFGALVFE